MKVVLQRVSSAEVTVDGRSVGAIGTGFVLLVGFKASDGEIEATWMADKVVGLRVFPDAEIPTIDMILLLIVFGYFFKIYKSDSAEPSLIPNN